MNKVAYWINGLGEEMSSRVHARFTHGEHSFVVVHDWREGTRGHGFIVMDETDLIALRTAVPHFRTAD